MAHRGRDLEALVRHSADGYRQAALVVANDRVRGVFEVLASERSRQGRELALLGPEGGGDGIAGELAWSRRLAAYPPRTLHAEPLLLEAGRMELALAHSYRSALATALGRGPGVTKVGDPTQAIAAVLERHLVRMARAAAVLSHLHAALGRRPRHVECMRRGDLQ